MIEALVPSLLGVALGMRHALEPDHLAAVSTLATEQKSARAGVVLGALWGVGHSLSLLVVGGTLAVLGAQMPQRMEQAFELCVALMIIGLGVRAVRKALREGREGPEHEHAHGEVSHTHAAAADHLHVRGWTLATRPLLIGLLHGLAGSGALTALVLAELPSSGARLSYIALFGAGSVVGMALLTGLAGLPLMRIARAPRLASGLLLFTGLVSTAIGAWWGYASGVALLGS